MCMCGYFSVCACEFLGRLGVRVCVCECMNVCMYLAIHAYLCYESMYTYVCLRMYICEFVRMRVCGMCVFMRGYTYK